MAEFKIQIDADLQSALNLPPCDEIKIPFPGPLKVQLPTGGSIQAFSDLSRGIPTDCSLTFNLMLQIAPLLASMECLLKILKLLKPLIDVIKGLPMPPVKAIQEFAKAAVDLAPCLLVPTPASILPFLRDLLCLILKALKCFLSQMKSLMRFMNGIELRLQDALNSGNDELARTLQCAQENAQLQAQGLTRSIEPIGVILDMMGALFEIGGVAPIKIPSLASPSDLQAMNGIVESIQTVVATLQIVVDGLGGCGNG